jgi:c-di-GMP-binding flagellar brake protein YcgR
MDERRRYFRIEDSIGIQYEVLNDREAAARQAAIDRGEFGTDNSLQEAERQLQLLIDKLRVQNPEFADAIDLLNTKFNLLKNNQESGLSHVKVVRASISACGVSFEMREQIRPGEQVYVDITLLPTDLHVQTVAEVVSCREVPDAKRWLVSMDFVRLSHDVEELLIQHVVKRQGRLLAEQRQNKP